MKGWIVGLVLLASPVSAQPVLTTLMQERAQLPTPMASSQIGALLNTVAWVHRGEGWGLISKPQGSNCPTPASVPVSCDILLHPSGAFDVLLDAESAGVPQFARIGEPDFSRFIAPVDPGGVVPPSPVPPSPPYPVPDPIDDVVAMLRQSRGEDSAQQERIYVDLKASIADSTAQILAEVRASHSALREQIREHDAAPMWLTKVVSNRYVQIIAAAVGTWITERLVRE